MIFSGNKVVTFAGFFSLCLVLMIFFTTSAQAKPFEGKKEGFAIFVGEVACYGEHELQNQFLTTFRDQLWQSLKDSEFKGKFHTVGDGDWLGAGDSDSSFMSIIKVDDVLKNIHMDAIAYGPSFRREVANVQMIKYAENVFGEDYFWDDAKLEAKKKLIGRPYRISQKMTEAAKTVGREYGADYLLFCNLVDADVELKNSIFNASVSNIDERPKKLKVESFFYLIDAKTGLVYEGYNLSDKTGQILSLLGDYGKAMTAEKLLEAMFRVQSSRISEDIVNGKKILEKGI